MKIKKIFTGLAIMLISATLNAQDQRTIQTKAADLLARMPANDLTLTNSLMNDMLKLGDEGMMLIFSQLKEPGTGDDTRARFAVESFSRYLSQKGEDDERTKWEKQCIEQLKKVTDNTVADFFMKQLQLIGGDNSVDAMKDFLVSKSLCEPALAVILASNGKNAEAVLAASLKNRELPCAAAVMNALALMKSKMAVAEYITWAATKDVNTRASAYNALAASGSPEALKTLSDAVAGVGYRWEHTGAVASLLSYAETIGKNGNIATADKICRLVMAKCNDETTIQNKADALAVYTGLHGPGAMTELLKAAAHKNEKYRAAAMRYSLDLPGAEITGKWTSFYRNALPDAKPQLIAMLGTRNDELALPLVTSALSDPDQRVRIEAAEAVAKLGGNEAINSLINYMLRFESDDDQKAAKNALMTVMSRDDFRFLVPVLREGTPAARRTAVELFAWGKDNKYFSDIALLTSSDNAAVRNAAFRALSTLASDEDQPHLVEILQKTEEKLNVADVQNALASAALKTGDPGKRSAFIIKTINENRDKIGSHGVAKLVPVLAKTGGSEALSLVLREFGSNDPELRESSFSALAGWCDYSASSALYEIAAAGNAKYSPAAFDGFVRQVSASPLSGENKYLLLRKIMLLAGNADTRNKVLTELGKLKTYQNLFFVSLFLDDPATSAVAAKAAMYIALPTVSSRAGMVGTKVREILLKAAEKLTGMESQYDKELINKYLANMPPDEGFSSMFNGTDLSGWHGLVEDPLKRAAMKPQELAKKQAEADKKVPLNWSVKDGCIWFNGRGDNLCSIKEYADFELLADWKITKKGDSGFYLRGTPQVQIWDTSRTDVGAQVGSGGLYNNLKNPSKPLSVADNPVGEWNTFRIIMIGENVSVWLNGKLVVDNVTFENYWSRGLPIFPKGPIELQAHGTDLAFRDLYVREITDKEYNLTPEERSEGFVSVFNGRNLDNWTGNKQSYVVEDGNIIVKPGEGSGGNLYTEKEYSDFVFRFEFQLTPAANNGLGIRAPLNGDAAYVGMELQILDDTAPVYADLQPYQYHGSVYGVIPSKKGFQKPVGEWNYEEVIAEGTHIKITLNGTVIVDGDIAEPRDKGTMDHKEHPGLRNKTGHIGFLGHGSELKFRNIRIKDLGEKIK